ncbi:ATP-dependent helicase C-terminal domain-containing protein [Streptomyces lavendulocolor]|uniref:ATP-dependent helicase C-terminal domain-containing protein n=1 Tax=Streptomyces lavendulocolor TaxID=67316 RepID=UPI003C2C9FEC
MKELSGWSAAFASADGRASLTVHLLSPVGHPAGVIGDLASFRHEGYRAVRARARRPPSPPPVAAGPGCGRADPAAQYA